MGAVPGKRILGIMVDENFYCFECMKPEELKEAKKNPKRSIVTTFDIHERDQSFACDRCDCYFDADSFLEEG